MGSPVAILGLPSVGDVIEKIVSSVWGKFADVLIPDPLKDATGKFFAWLVAVPNPARAASMPNIDKLQTAVMALSVAIFALVVLTASVRYFFAGVAGQANPLEALGRAMVAAVGLLAYKWGFGNAIAVVNVLTDQIFAWPIVRTGTNQLAATTFSAAVFGGGNPLGAIFALVAFALVLALIAMKIALMLVLTVLYVGGSLTIAVWPLPELSGYTRSWLEVLRNVLAVPLLWTLVFATAGLIAKDVPTLLGINSTGFARGALTAIITPLLTIIVLYLSFRIASGSVSSIKAAGSQFVAQGSSRSTLGAVATGMMLSQGRGSLMRAVRGGTGGNGAAALGTGGAQSTRSLAVSAAAGAAGTAASNSNGVASNSQAKNTTQASDAAANRGNSQKVVSNSPEGPTQIPSNGRRTPQNDGGAVKPKANTPQKRPSAPQLTPQVEEPRATHKPERGVSPAPSRPTRVKEATPSASTSPAPPRSTPRSSTPPASSTKPSQRSKVERADGASTPSTNKPARPRRRVRSPRGPRGNP